MPSNMMFLEDSNGNPTKVKMFDFAISRPRNVSVVDLLYFLYVCTDRQFREAHEEEVLRAYFDIFSKYHKPGSVGDFKDFLGIYEDARLIGMFGTTVSHIQGLIWV